VERVPENADGDRKVRAAKVGPPEKRERPVASRDDVGVRFCRDGRERLGDERIFA